jgi:hypothetical protein
MWSSDGLSIFDEQGRKIASTAYARARGCSMRISAEEKAANVALMRAAPELAAQLALTIPLLIRLGDCTGNAYGRCEIIGAAGELLDALGISYQQTPKVR